MTARPDSQQAIVPSNLNIENIETLLQIDAAINPGNSGARLCKPGRWPGRGVVFCKRAGMEVSSTSFPTVASCETPPALLLTSAELPGPLLPGVLIPAHGEPELRAYPQCYEPTHKVRTFDLLLSNNSGTQGN
jgi:hypothetical protein